MSEKPDKATVTKYLRQYDLLGMVGRIVELEGFVTSLPGGGAQLAAEAKIERLIKAGDAILSEPLPWENNAVVAAWDEAKR